MNNKMMIEKTTTKQNKIIICIIFILQFTLSNNEENV